MNAQGLAPHTGKIFEGISRLECIKPFVLVGGTALSIQLNTRQSEDLDFMRWKTGKDDNLDIGWPAIQRDLESVGTEENVDVYGFDQVRFVVEGVKVSFYAAPRRKIPTMREIPFLNNLRLADVESIGVMKMEAMMRRSKFRDYYDIYSILKSGVDIMKMIPAALEHSGYRLKRKSLMAILSNGDLFRKDEHFEQLQPVYHVSSNDIQEYIKSLLQPSR
jgi:predicted nucleotidyltransferase component of viral defense system